MLCLHGYDSGPDRMGQLVARLAPEWLPSWCMQGPVAGCPSGGRAWWPDAHTSPSPGQLSAAVAAVHAEARSRPVTVLLGFSQGAAVAAAALAGWPAGVAPGSSGAAGGAGGLRLVVLVSGFAAGAIEDGTAPSCDSIMHVWGEADEVVPPELSAALMRQTGKLARQGQCRFVHDRGHVLGTAKIHQAIRERIEELAEPVEPPQEQPGPAGDWRHDPAVAKLVERMAGGELPTTREFVRIIFRWSKKKSCCTPEQFAARSVEMVDWMRLLELEGDQTCGAPAQPQLQPSYGFNAVVNACQRLCDAKGAMLAAGRLREYGYQHDVFTCTALIDVLSREGDVDGAMQVYRSMKADGATPNAITFSTAIRGVTHTSRRWTKAQQSKGHSVPRPTRADLDLAFGILEHAVEAACNEPLPFVDFMRACASCPDPEAAAMADCALRMAVANVTSPNDGGQLGEVALQVLHAVQDRTEATGLASEWAQLLECEQLANATFDSAGVAGKQQQKRFGCLEAGSLRLRTEVVTEGVLCRHRYSSECMAGE